MELINAFAIRDGLEMIVPVILCSKYHNFSVCANDAVCAPGQVCDRSFAIKGYKSFNCTPAGNSFFIVDQTDVYKGADIGFLQGCFTAQWDFPPPVNGTVPIGQGNITSYDGPIGAPFVFNCSFTDCTQGIYMFVEQTQFSRYQ